MTAAESFAQLGDSSSGRAVLSLGAGASTSTASPVPCSAVATIQFNVTSEATLPLALRAFSRRTSASGVGSNATVHQARLYITLRASNASILAAVLNFSSVNSTHWEFQRSVYHPP